MTYHYEDVYQTGPLKRKIHEISDLNTTTYAENYNVCPNKRPYETVNKSTNAEESIDSISHHETSKFGIEEENSASLSDNQGQVPQIENSTVIIHSNALNQGMYLSFDGGQFTNQTVPNSIEHQHQLNVPFIRSFHQTSNFYHTEQDDDSTNLNCAHSSTKMMHDNLETNLLNNSETRPVPLNDVESIFIPANFECIENEEDQHLIPKNDTDKRKSIVKNETANILSQNSLTRHIFIENQRSILYDILDFNKKIHSLFIYNPIKSLDDDLLVFCTNLKTFMIHQVKYVDSLLSLENSDKNKSIRAKSLKSGLNLDFFHPLKCSANFNKKEEIEEEFLLSLPSGKVGMEITCFFRYFFKLSFMTYAEPFTPEKLFSSKILDERIKVYEKLLEIYDCPKIIISHTKQKKFLRIEYHKLFSDNLEMKYHYIPEFFSIMYVILRALSTYDRIITSKNFLCIFFFLYSLNNFFYWINDYYEEERKKLESQRDSPLSKLISQMISFTLRVSFIEPLCSQLNVHKNAQLRYHFLHLNVLCNELHKFLCEENPRFYIAEDAKTLMPVIILIEKYIITSQSSDVIQFNADALLKLEALNLLFFSKFINSLNQDPNFTLSHQLQKLKLFFDMYFLTLE